MRREGEQIGLEARRDDRVDAAGENQDGRFEPSHQRPVVGELQHARGAAQPVGTGFGGDFGGVTEYRPGFVAAGQKIPRSGEAVGLPAELFQFLHAFL